MCGAVLRALDSAASVLLLDFMGHEARLQRDLVGRDAPHPQRGEEALGELMHRVPFRHHCCCGGTEAENGKAAPEAHTGVQAAGRAALQR